ncbi:NADPH:quinone oxidoreductase family protein [Rhodococcus erythropolis]|uniref:NADPH:quinone oxidoreductase family protein n=1 Tax=Rhodococcus erythropolis TaxID=1833 RepID=UPI000878F2EF|nr:NADPH:quinone oxidoreductase family protein [Rhodococcus erythropolis]OFV76415.1 mycocerosic acid synthase [Rhodococcus erythropolis]
MSRAWRVHQYGEPEAVLRLEQTPDLVPGPGQIRVRVAAVSCNFADVLLCRGGYQQKPPPPFTPGLEACGWVDALGADVDSGLLTARVVGQPVLPHGGFSETTLMDATEAHVVPSAIDDVTAATLHLTYLSAWLGLHRRGAIAAGDVVVVTAAAGGVGSAAVQLAHAAGATVIGIVSGADKAATAVMLGADVVIDRSRQNVIESVKSVAPQGADVVFDSVGGDAYNQATKYIAFEGRIVVVGFASSEIPHARLNHPMVKNYTIVGLHWSLYSKYRPDLVHRAQSAVFDMASSGLITPLIHRRAELHEVPAALSELASGRVQGKTVITI